MLDASHLLLNVPKYLNVASLGVTLAHEALHSLDRTGREFGADGALTKWWDEASERAFHNASACIVEQYASHFRRPLRIDARSILVEVSARIYCTLEV